MWFAATRLPTLMFAYWQLQVPRQVIKLSQGLFNLPHPANQLSLSRFIILQCVYLVGNSHHYHFLIRKSDILLNLAF